MIRVSVSDVDAFEYFMGQEDPDLGALLRRIRREDPPTLQMQAGTALHSCLELSVPGDYQSMECGGFVFDFTKLEANVDIPVMREIKATKEYSIDGQTVVLVGKVDAVDADRVDDHKTTTRFDAERFEGMFQWRAYLDIFGANRFRWNVFEMKPDRNDDHLFHVYAVHPLWQYRYTTLAEDVEKRLTAYVDFARVHLPEMFTEEKAA